jgi:hypothetical protein
MHARTREGEPPDEAAFAEPFRREERGADAGHPEAAPVGC